MKKDKELVRTAVMQNSLALKFGMGDLNQNRQFLQLFGLDFRDSLGANTASRDEWIVQSVKFGLHAEASDFSTKTHQRIHGNAYLGKFHLHNPSAFNKGFCDINPDGSINWALVTEKSFPCRGTKETCGLPNERDGHPTSLSCWRY